MRNNTSETVCPRCGGDMPMGYHGQHYCNGCMDDFADDFAGDNLTREVPDNEED